MLLVCVAPAAKDLSPVGPPCVPPPPPPDSDNVDGGYPRRGSDGGPRTGSGEGSGGGGSDGNGNAFDLDGTEGEEEEEGEGKSRSGYEGGAAAAAAAEVVAAGGQGNAGGGAGAGIVAGACAARGQVAPPTADEHAPIPSSPSFGGHNFLPPVVGARQLVER